MESLSSYIKVSAQKALEQARYTLFMVKREREKKRKEVIKEVIERKAKPSFFGLIPGKTIAEEEAIQWIESLPHLDQYVMGWTKDWYSEIETQANKVQLLAENSEDGYVWLNQDHLSAIKYFD